MTQTTEQERAEFLKANIRGPFDEALNHREREIAFKAWQAARRAPVVPQELREAAQDALAWLEDDDANLTHNIRERLRLALAAAPQPPEQAPVQMPEQDLQKILDEVEDFGAASFNHGLNIIERINAKQNKDVFRDAHALWDKCQAIQHQVRQLLAAQSRDKN